MKLALIPPISALEQFGHGRFQLVLAQWLLKYPSYMDFYHWQAKQGAYIIVDNGAYEGDPVEFEMVVHLARELQAREVVLPDVLWDQERTVEKVLAAYGTIDDEFRWMLVPQGDTAQRWRECYDTLIYEYPLKDSPVIGLPKRNVYFNGGRIELIREVRSIRPATEFHLLGYTEGDELAKLTQSHIVVRSLDTAEPFVRALAGLSFDPTARHTREGDVHRSETYAEDNLVGLQWSMAFENALRLKEAAREHSARTGAPSNW